MKLLIVEDDEEIVEAISLAFQIRWPEAKIVSTRYGKKGIELVESEQPDIVILDLGLPDINGFDVLRKIRLFSQVPIMLSKEEYIKEIKQKVPELAGESPEDIEDKISEMLDWLINNICKPIRYTTKRDVGYLHEVGAYQCHHPQIGTFYLFHDEESNYDAGVYHLSFSLARSEKKVLDSYRDVLSEMESEEEPEEW